MIDFRNIENVYFLGIGGIGMSALARYFKHAGKNVSGYDRTPTHLTDNLAGEGIPVHFNDDVAEIPAGLKPENTLAIFTPALPPGHRELAWFRENNFTLLKRAKVLGELCASNKSIAIAGTHGKTSITTMVSVIMSKTATGCGAFLGGISKNFKSNLVLSPSPESWIVAEGDEYDRSFLNLYPNLALISAIDPDHLDIYGDFDTLKDSFLKFAANIKTNGCLVIKKGAVTPEFYKNDIKIYTYSLDQEADFYASEIELFDGKYRFTLNTPDGKLKGLLLNFPGLTNVENIVGAAAIATLAGASEQNIRDGISDYAGVVRRFDIRFRSPETIFIDDYAHHPEELRAVISSMKKLFPGKKVTGIFQPHLYSRTRDLADGFAQSLDLLDETILLPVYPAREEPIEGVSSEIILQKMESGQKQILGKDEVLSWVENNSPDVLMTLGAGDIDKVADSIEEILRRKSHV